MGGTKTHCIDVDWPASYTWSARQYRRGYAGPNAWMGSLIFESRDASGLYYRRNRYYDSEKGRFTQEDPIGLAGGVNLYGFGAGDPLSFVDAFGMDPDTIKIQSHKVVKALPYRHTAIRIIPDDQAKWSKDPRFEKGADGRYFLTLGAGPEPCTRVLCLVSKYNRPADAAEHPGGYVIDLRGRDENAVIQRLLNLDAAYSDKALYTMFPAMPYQHNSNSYVAGLLKAAGFQIFGGGLVFPGWQTPLPQRYFR